MKRFVVLMVFFILTITSVIYCDASGNIEAFIEVLPDIVVELTPDDDADSSGVGTGNGVLNFGTITTGESRNTYDQEDGVGGTNAVITIKRPYKDVGDLALGLEAVKVDFTLEDEDGTLGVVKFKASGTWDDDETDTTPEITKEMEAELIVSQDIDASTIIGADTVIKDNSNTPVDIGKMSKVSPGTYIITIDETSAPAGTGALAKEVSPRVFVHGKIDGEDVKVDGDYTGNITLTVKYSADNSWMH